MEKIKLAARVVNASSSGTVVPAISETGGAYNSGRSGLTDSFVSGFWFNDLLGALARHGHAFGCRQAILGGHYALVRTRDRDFAPDLYSMVLWRRLMSPKVRGRRHCAHMEAHLSATPPVLTPREAPSPCRPLAPKSAKLATEAVSGSPAPCVQKTFRLGKAPQQPKQVPWTKTFIPPHSS